MSRRAYAVTLRFEFPAWDEHDGYTYVVHAGSKSEAIKRARRQAEDDGHVGGRGRYWFRAEETR